MDHSITGSSMRAEPPASFEGKEHPCPTCLSSRALLTTEPTVYPKNRFNPMAHTL